MSDQGRVPSVSNHGRSAYDPVTAPTLPWLTWRRAIFDMSWSASALQRSNLPVCISLLTIQWSLRVGIEIDEPLNICKDSLHLVT